MFIIHVDLEKCSCCGLCVAICPEDVFQECPEGKVDPVKYGSCTGCMSCVETCPEKCIEVKGIK